MPFSTIATPDAKPVANYKMATRMEGGRLLYIAGQVAWDTSGNVVGKGDARAQARQVFQGELPASTLIVVKSLFHPDFLIEVEGIASV